MQKLGIVTVGFGTARRDRKCSLNDQIPNPNVVRAYAAPLAHLSALLLLRPAGHPALRRLLQRCEKLRIVT